MKSGVKKASPPAPSLWLAPETSSPAFVQELILQIEAGL